MGVAMFFDFLLRIISFLGLSAFAQTNSIAQMPKLTTAPIVRVHIFIHGTYLPGLIFLDPKATLKHKIGEHSPYLYALKYARSKETESRRQILLGQGLQEVVCETLADWQQKKLPANLKHKAAIHVLAAYDQFADKKEIVNKYFTYGWLGVLDDDYRCSEAKKLYIALTQLYEELQKKYPGNKIEFVLNGHSHGGNLILYLAKYEHEYKKKLPIIWVGLYATPVQSETVNFCKDPLFKNIFLIYSYGDIVQNNDRFSTKTKKSYRKFTDLISLKDAPNNIYQICVCAHDKSNVFGHQSMFCLDSYYQLTRVHRHSKPHRCVVNALSPLPLVTFSPIIMQLLPQVSTGPITLSVKQLEDTCFFALSDNNAYVQSENLLSQLTYIKKNIKSN